MMNCSKFATSCFVRTDSTMLRQMYDGIIGQQFVFLYYNSIACNLLHHGRLHRMGLWCVTYTL